MGLQTDTAPQGSRGRAINGAAVRHCTLLLLLLLLLNLIVSKKKLLLEGAKVDPPIPLQSGMHLLQK